jgi:hypothetical protein
VDEDVPGVVRGVGQSTARLFECASILVGIVGVLGIVTLRQETAGANEGTVAYTLAAWNS